MRTLRFAFRPCRLAAAALALGLGSALIAIAPVAAQAAAATAETTAATGAAAPIQSLDEALLAAMKAGHSASFQQRYNMLAPAVEKALDLPFILRISVGPGWSSMSPQEQQKLLDAFQRYTIATYVDNFDSYDGQKFVISTPRPLPTGEQVVPTEIVPAKGEGHKLDYVMHKTADGQWKAIDVLADGAISRVAVQRSDWNSLLASGGAPALLATLQKKTEALSQG